MTHECLKRKPLTQEAFLNDLQWVLEGLRDGTRKDDEGNIDGCMSMEYEDDDDDNEVEESEECKEDDRDVDPGYEPHSKELKEVETSEERKKDDRDIDPGYEPHSKELKEVETSEERKKDDRDIDPGYEPHSKELKEMETSEEHEEDDRDIDPGYEPHSKELKEGETSEERKEDDRDIDPGYELHSKELKEVETSEEHKEDDRDVDPGYEPHSKELKEVETSEEHKEDDRDIDPGYEPHSKELKEVEILEEREKDDRDIDPGYEPHSKELKEVETSEESEEDDRDIDQGYKPHSKELKEVETSEESEEDDYDIDQGYEPHSKEFNEVQELEESEKCLSSTEIIPCSADESDNSDIYPALKSQPIIFQSQPMGNKKAKKRKIEEDEDENQILDESEIARDLKNPKIYIRLIMKNSHTIKGKWKKSDRVYNSAHPCPFCDKCVTNFSHHILSKQHENEDEVIELGDNPAERKRKIQLLRLKGSHVHNVKVLQKKSGEVFMLRRSCTVANNEEDDEAEETEKENDSRFSVDRYGPCPQCLGWILQCSVKRHLKTCCGTDCDQYLKMSKGNLIVQSDILAEKMDRRASKALIEETFKIMQHDEVSKVAKSDPLIVTLGNNWMLRNVGNKLMRCYYTSSVMRLAAKFKLELQKIDGGDKDLGQLLSPKSFDNTVLAALKCCNQDDEEDLKSPTNAIKLGYDIKRMASAKLATALKEGDETVRKDAEGFLKLMDMEWGTKVNKLARVTLTERAFNVTKQLPLPEDIKALATYLQNELETLDLMDYTRGNFRRIATLTLARVTLYNRRRCHEVQAMRLTTYAQRTSDVNGVSRELRGQLTEFETHLLERQEVVIIRGKTGKGVPVILPPDVLNCMQYLANPVARAITTTKENPYLFANTNIGVYRAYDAIRMVTMNAGLKMPHLIRTSNMRKYFATMLQALDTTEAERQWVVDHLGHTMDIHRVHYRQTSDLLERVDVAKILLIQDMGLVGKYRGKKLQDIQLNDIVVDSRESTPRNEEADVPVDAPVDEIDMPVDTSDETDIPVDASIDETYIPEIPGMELEEEEFEEISPKPRKRKTKQLTRKPWSTEEVKEIEDLFHADIQKDACPGQKTVEKMMRISRQRKGYIHLRERDTIKKKISNMLIKRRKQSKVPHT